MVRLHLILLACAMTLCGCSRSSHKAPTEATLRREFPAQFDRVDFYAQNFTKFLNTPPFPPEGSDKVDRALFQIPQILSFNLSDEATNVGLQPDSWSRDPLVRARFGMTDAVTAGKPSIKVGSGTTKSGKEVEIVIYESIIVERATGKKLRGTITFNLHELPPEARE